MRSRRTGGARENFGSMWLARRLRMLLPGYPDVRLCVASSGGADSTALLGALAGLLRRSGPALRAVHVDHHLQKASGDWARHCRKLARKLHVPLTVLSAQVSHARGESLEAAARAARYAVLSESLEAGEFLLTAHHADDQAETVLLQLLRGAGLPGLAAMPALARFASGWIARPLLDVRRASLEAWARERGIDWIDDAMNADRRFDRAFVRLDLLPAIYDRWPGAADAIARTARHAAEAQRLLEALADADLDRAADGAALRASRLRALPPERRRNALRRWIHRAGVPLPDSRRLAELAGPMLDARADANPRVTWGGVGVGRHRDRLTLSSTEKDSGPPPRRDRKPGGGDGGDGGRARIWRWRKAPLLVLDAGHGALELRRDAHGPIDVAALPASLVVRARAGGERLRPHRDGPTRTLKSLLQSSATPLEERASLPLVFARERLVAAAGRWIDASIQATPATRERARLIWRKEQA